MTESDRARAVREAVIALTSDQAGRGVGSVGSAGEHEIDPTRPAREPPNRPLTPRESSVAELVGRGYPYWRVALALGISPKTARNITDGIADALPNPDRLPPQTLVMLWAAHRRWLREQRAAA